MSVGIRARNGALQRACVRVKLQIAKKHSRLKSLYLNRLKPLITHKSFLPLLSKPRPSNYEEDDQIRLSPDLDTAEWRSPEEQWDFTISSFSFGREIDPRDSGVSPDLLLDTLLVLSSRYDRLISILGKMSYYRIRISVRHSSYLRSTNIDWLNILVFVPLFDSRENERKEKKIKKLVEITIVERCYSQTTN